MGGSKSVEIGHRPLTQLAGVLDNASFERFAGRMHRAADRLRGHTLWNINSTAQGGGVAEMLASLLPYARDAGWDARWAVISGDGEFFRVTKGIHNALHASPPAGDIWNEGSYAAYQRVTESNLEGLLDMIAPGDVVFIHDPQTAGLIAPLVAAGARVSWQCHVGTDTPNDHARHAWSFLHPFVDAAQRYVFSRQAYLWDGLDHDRLRVIPPSIDALSTKNAELTDEEVRSILQVAGVLDGHAMTTTKVHRQVERDGGLAPIDPEARIVGEVSRWDRLKDPVGFLRMFADGMSDLSDVHLVYAGPSVAGVDDDPEGAEVLAECIAYRRSLPAGVADRIHLLSLPMDDVDENATIVNALQRRADVIVQKSLAEGFGLTVTEAMWKSKPVVASRVGGIQDQITHGVSGLLVDDPREDLAFAKAVRSLLEDPERARQLGEAAGRRVREHYLHPRQLMQWVDLIDELLG